MYRISPPHMFALLYSLAGACAGETSGDTPCHTHGPLENVTLENGAVALRLMSFNVYWMHAKNGDWEGIAETIQEINPDLASIQEAPMWEHQVALLRVLNNGSAGDYEFVPRDGNASDEWWWDGPILFRANTWTLREGGMIEYRQSWSTQWGSEENSPRGVSFAALQHRSGAGLLVYGVHPVCCMGDWPAQEAIELVLQHMNELRSRWHWPVVIMGDFNAKWSNPSLGDLRSGNNSHQLLFHQASSSFHYEIDHILTQSRLPDSLHVLQEQTWCSRGGSDHAPLVVDAWLAPPPSTSKSRVSRPLEIMLLVMLLLGIGQ